jgi:AraC family transcriptional regulator of adaptative response/methylated-DNA-[protein]-cysteine methyltransferase
MATVHFPNFLLSLRLYGVSVSDYDRIAKAIAYIIACAGNQPSLEDIAAHLNLSPFHFQRLFSRWAGVTPKRFLQALTLERAKQLLSESRPVLDVSHELGLGSGSRLYDHFVHLEATTPGEFKQGGLGMSIDYGIHETPFGEAFVATTERGVCRLGFLEFEDLNEQIRTVTGNWPQAEVNLDQAGTTPTAKAIFSREGKSDRPLSLAVSGTNFQVSVWKALLRIPPGTVTSYNQVAAAIDKPRSARAVGTAVGANPVAFLIPCHRVIRKSGGLGGYHWGETRKHAIHAWESAVA